MDFYEWLIGQLGGLNKKKSITHSSLETWKTNTKKLEVAEGFCTVL